MTRRARIDASRPAPPLTPLGSRASEIVTAARTLLDEEGTEALTMRRLGDALSVKAPSLYKHLPGKGAIESLLVEQGLLQVGTALREAVHRLTPARAVRPLFEAYRRTAALEPNLYRLATQGPLPRDQLAEGLEDWAGEPFVLVLGEPYLAQAAWSAAHGIASLELDDRYPPGTDTDRTWAAAADAFAAAMP